ncbi:MAG: GNAT family N-acetyltransferase [Methylococcaceae bacterium]
MKIKHSIKQWDSDFFGYPVGEAFIEAYSQLDYPKMRALFLEADYHLVYLFPAHSAIVEELGKNDIPVWDKKITYFKGRKDFYTGNDLYDIESYEMDTQYDRLLTLALASGAFSRFALDDNFERDIFYRLYKVWLDSSLSKAIANDVLVYKIDNRIVGFITYKIISQVLQVGLLAVDQKCRGKGIGSALMQTIESIAQSKNLISVSVETQNANASACRFYEKNKYQVRHKQDICHLWII